MILYAVISVLGFLSYGFIGIGKFVEVFVPWETIAPFVSFDENPEWVAPIYGIFFTSIATFYVMLGGMHSIVWADVVQFGIMVVAGIAIGAIAMYKVSPEMLVASTPEGWSSPFFGWKLDMDWTEILPAINEKIVEDQYGLFTIFVMMMLFKGVFMSMAGPAANYDMQKILACRSPKEAALMSGSVSVILLIPRYLMIMGFHGSGFSVFQRWFCRYGSPYRF